MSELVVLNGGPRSGDSVEIPDAPRLAPMHSVRVVAPAAAGRPERVVVYVRVGVNSDIGLPVFSYVGEL